LHSVNLIPVQHIVDVWREVEPGIVRALEHSLGESDQYDILAELVRGQKQLWTVHDEEFEAVAVTEIGVWPKAK